MNVCTDTGGGWYRDIEYSTLVAIYGIFVRLVAITIGNSKNVYNVTPTDMIAPPTATLFDPSPPYC